MITVAVYAVAGVVVIWGVIAAGDAIVNFWIGRE